MSLHPNVRLLALAAVAAVTLAPYAADSGTCMNPAARDLLVGSYADAQLNSPKGEDTNFFIKAGGVPNIMLLLDNSGSMNRLPPDGPNSFGKILPPGYYGGESDQTTAFKAINTTTVPAFCKGAAVACTGNAQCCSGTCTANKCTAPGPTNWSAPANNTRIVGCGLDPVSAGSADFIKSSMYQELESRRFYPPCGQSTDPSLFAQAYNPTDAAVAPDYAANMTLCPYLTTGSNNVTTGAPGFDPDFYNATKPMGTTSSGTKLQLFGKNLVFHDNPDRGTRPLGFTAGAGAFGHNFGDGFNSQNLWPHKVGAAESNAAAFCKTQILAAPATQKQGLLTHEEICNACLTKKGWYYDGVILANRSENSTPTPSIWYTGNYLSFFPPKFLLARKVLKDVIAAQTRVRVAIAVLNGGPVVKEFSPSCQENETSNFDSSRSTYAGEIDTVSFDPHNQTPLAVSLFNVGRYYHTPDNPWFDNAWEKTPNASKPWESDFNANGLAVCYSCQTSSVILFTDGQPTSGDGDGLPPKGLLAKGDLDKDKKAGDATTGIRGIGITDPTVCPECTTFKKQSGVTYDYRDNLTKVAFYLKNMDLRADTEETRDCNKNDGAQYLNTYTIGFATKAIPSVNTILGNAAKVGGGMFISAENTVALKEGFNAIIEEINGRSTSFSVATVSTLQTMSGNAAHIPRFSPAKTAHWPGHLFRYELYSEFVEGCTPGDPTTDKNCDKRCDGVFLIDSEGAFISEDTNGAFKKNAPSTQPVCAQAPACGNKNCASASSADAVAFWDAAKSWGELEDGVPKREWKNRNVWTAVDRDGDGDIEADDKGDEMVNLKGATDAAVTKIIPYLALGGGTICNTVAGRLATAGDAASAALVAPTGDPLYPLQCAKAIVRYVLGADLFNERGLDATRFPPASMDLAEDREAILGDIFHSSPAKVIAPLPSSSRIARLGLENQTIISLWDTDTKNGVPGYSEYQKSGLYRDRRRIVLVGANDGMLHAFNDGIFVPDGAGGGAYETGALDGAMELWGFIPPDLISKLPLLLGSDHQLFVDGTAMVRDVWVDGSGNGLGKGTPNDLKEGTEFHTVAVVGERRGGTRFFALDVTDATEVGTVPRFLWVYPQPNSKEALTFGETYTDFLPTPPPIGPVRVATGGIYPTHADSPKYRHDGSNTPFHETWVAFLNGGYDPQYVRGRGVHMVDVWTGKEIWDFSYPDNPASIPAADPRQQLRFPIPAVVGMVRWGVNEKLPNETNPDGADNYYDTATFGDAGGQLWTLRYHEPARLDANGLATNWFGARSFQMGGKVGCKLCGGQPFFQITANSPTPADRLLRTYAGTGDRFNLTDKFGGTCSPTNLRACVMRGCTVTVTQTNNVLSAPGPGFLQRGMTEVACNALTSSQLAGPTVACQVDATARVVISACPSPASNGGLVATTKDMAMQCTELPDGYQCSRTTAIPGNPIALSDTSNVPVTGNWFFSLRMFREGSSADPLSLPVFKTAAEAQTYDAHRHWVTQSNTIRASSGPVLLDSTSIAGNATEESAGWAMYYNHTPTVAIGTTSVNVDWKDERTASGTSLGASLVSWNAVIPPTSTVSDTSGGKCSVSVCTQEDRRVNFMYGANPVTGAAADAFLDASGNMVRSIGSYRLVPAQAMQSTYFVNSKGQVQQSLTGISPEAGAINVGSSEAEDAMSEADFLVVDRELYECRHSESPICK